MTEILGAPYNGRKAASYEAKRKSKKKWKDENTFASMILTDAKGSLLDVAVGTGRFLPLYKKLGLKVTGLDISNDMLRLAAKHKSGAKLMAGNAVALQFNANTFDTVVCVRLLHLVNELTMRKMLAELFRVARKHILLTIQLGDRYRAGHDTATHDAMKFRSLVRKQGWFVLSEQRLTSAGWYIMCLVKESAHGKIKTGSTDK
jgi:ubiquinone/menaquinone biosynthesis C-methylase UbiE